MKKLQRGLTLITALAIVAIFLAVALTMLELATHNGQNVGAGYTKQQYFDVAEAGIDRGLTDIDSNLPAPGSTANATAPPLPPPTPSGDQTALPSIPGVVYHYSYWHNNSNGVVSTPDPLNAQGFGAGSNIPVPAYGTLVWSYTKNTGRDVGVEVVASVFSSNHSSCAMCAGGNISVGGSTSGSPPGACKSGLITLKVCTDPNVTPPPTAVPIVAGGSYTWSGSCSGPCAYGDGAVTPNSNIQQNASTGGFLDSQATIDTLSNAKYWQSIANNSTIFYTDCSSGCSQTNIKATSIGSVQFLNGNLSISNDGTKTPTNYAGLEIVNGCMTLGGKAQMVGGATGEIIVLGTDAQCGGYAFSISGNANWNSGTLYTAQGSASLAGTGNTKYIIFYGDLISEGNVTITGNGNFVWQSGTVSNQFFLDQYSVDSYLQY